LTGNPGASCDTTISPRGGFFAGSAKAAFGLFLMTAAFMLTKTGRDALYFQRDGFLQLPKAYLGIAILAGPAAAVALTLMRRFGPPRARVAATLGMAVAQILFFAVARPGGEWWMTLFFVLVPLCYGVLLAQAWLLAAELLETAPRDLLARLYSTLGASSMLGGLAGAALARAIGDYIEARALLAFGAIALAGSAAAMAVAQRRVDPGLSLARPEVAPPPAGGRYPPLKEMLGVLRHRYPLLLALVGIFGSITGVLIEFQFYWSVADPASTPRDNVALFANFYLLLNGAAFLVQILGMPPLQRRVGVWGSLLVLPGALIGGAAVAAVSASAFARAGLRIAESGLKSSIHRVNWEQAYLPLERSARAMTKLLVDGVAARVGEGAAAGILLFWLSGFDPGAAGSQSTRWIIYTLIGAAMVWLALTLKLAPDLHSFSREEARPDIPLPDG